MTESPMRAPSNLADLWRDYRKGKALTCSCGRPAGRIALSVLSAPRSYCFQCVACSWQSGWFQLPE
jgi:hypothetical protein